MLLKQKRRAFQNMSFMLDLIHIGIGIIIVGLAVVSFIEPQRYRVFLPIIFLLAAVLNMMNGVYGLRRSRPGRKKRYQAISTLVLGGVLILLTIISAVSIWWG